LCDWGYGRIEGAVTVCAILAVRTLMDRAAPIAQASAPWGNARHKELPQFGRFMNVLGRLHHALDHIQPTYRLRSF
jgi:hypothetical protein